MSEENNIVPVNISSDEDEEEEEEGDEDIITCDIEEAPLLRVDMKLPAKSKHKYEKAYEKLMQWKSQTNHVTLQEDVLVAYFKCLALKYKPSSLWANYSMLRRIIYTYHKINITHYTKLIIFLKTISKGYVSKKSRILSAKQMRKFLKEAPDSQFLSIKVALIFGVQGGCRRQEMCNITINNIIDKGDMILVQLKRGQTDKPRSFVISGEFYNIYKKYADLRPQGLTTERFFLNYRNGRCNTLVMGINTFGSIPRIIATYLNLDNPNSYTGHSFRKTSAFLSDAGLDLHEVVEDVWNVDPLKERRAVDPDWEPGNRSLLCSSHFVDNKKSEHPLNPSYLPTIFPENQNNKNLTIYNVYSSKKTSKNPADDDPWRIEPIDETNATRKSDGNDDKSSDDDSNQVMIPIKMEANSDECDDEVETNHKRKKFKADDSLTQKPDLEEVVVKVENEEMGVSSETDEILEEIEIKNEVFIKVEDESFDEETTINDEVENDDDKDSTNESSNFVSKVSSKPGPKSQANKGAIKVNQSKPQTSKDQNQQNGRVLRTLKGGKILIKTNAIKSTASESNKKKSAASVKIDEPTVKKISGTKIIKAKVPKLTLKSGKMTSENIVMLRKALKLKPDDKLTFASSDTEGEILKQAKMNGKDSSDDKKQDSQGEIDVENSDMHENKCDVGCQVSNSDEEADDDVDAENEPSFFICNRINGEKQCDVEVHVKINYQKPVKKEAKKDKKNNSEEGSGFIGFNSIQNDSQLKSLSNFDINAFMYLEDFMPKYGGIKVHKGNRLLILLMKLKTGLDFTALGTLFGMPEASAQRAFYTVLETLALKLNKFISWPSKFDISRALPEMFKKKYPCARAMVDTMEIEVELPREKTDAFSALELPKKIKKKFLFACSPDGRITFVSKCYESRVSDNFILKDSGFLNYLEPADLVLTNDGFPCIKIHIQNKGAIMVMPPFAHDEEFPPDENQINETNRDDDSMPAVKDYIQSCANRIRQFEILSKINDELQQHLNSIVKVICALINFQRAKYNAN